MCPSTVSAPLKRGVVKPSRDLSIGGEVRKISSAPIFILLSLLPFYTIPVVPILPVVVSRIIFDKQDLLQCTIAYDSLSIVQDPAERRLFTPDDNFCARHNRATRTGDDDRTISHVKL